MDSRVPETGTSDEPLSTMVVRAVAAYENERPHELPPLYESIDADALDRLFVRPAKGEGEGQSDVSVTFPYAGHQVTVFADGEVGIAAPEALEDRSS